MSMSKGGSVLRLRRSSVRLAARDRTDAAIAKPETPFVRVDELGDQISGNAWRAFRMDKKPASSARSSGGALFAFSAKTRSVVRIPGEVARESAMMSPTIPI